MCAIFCSSSTLDFPPTLLLSLQKNASVTAANITSTFTLTPPLPRIHPGLLRLRAALQHGAAAAPLPHVRPGLLPLVLPLLRRRKGASEYRVQVSLVVAVTPELTATPCEQRCKGKGVAGGGGYSLVGTGVLLLRPLDKPLEGVLAAARFWSHQRERERRLCAPSKMSQEHLKYRRCVRPSSAQALGVSGTVRACKMCNDQASPPHFALLSR